MTKLCQVLKGAGYLGSIDGSAFGVEIRERIGHPSDLEALRSDWVKVGKDMKVAVDKVSEDVEVVTG